MKTGEGPPAFLTLPICLPTGGHVMGSCADAGADRIFFGSHPEGRNLLT